jgi:hypothetical protein
MDLRIQIVAVLASAGVLLCVLELVRRRRLLERYAILWLFSATVLLALAAWKGLLEKAADAVGIYYAPSALFVVAFGFILLLLLHFSVAVSRLAEQSKVLAQRLALLEARNRELEADLVDRRAAEPADVRGEGRERSFGRRSMAAVGEDEPRS